MENAIKLDRPTTFGIFITTAVLVALLTSFFSYQATRETNRYLIDIETMNRESELVTFRYLKIYGAIEEISSLSEVNYAYVPSNTGSSSQDQDPFKDVVQQATARYNSVIKIFNRVKPLMDKSFLTSADIAIAEENRQSNVLTHAYYANEPLPEDVDSVTLLQARRRAEVAISEALENQMSSLTQVTSILKS